MTSETKVQLLPDGNPSLVHLELDALETYYLAISHLDVMHSLRVRNSGLSPDGSEDPLELRCWVDSSSESRLFFPSACEIQLPPQGVQVEVAALQVLPDRRRLALIAERSTASLIIEAVHRGELVGYLRRELNLLAGNEFMLSPRYWSSLSAFVHPGSPDLAPVLTRARDLLLDRTGSGGTPGYQVDAAGGERVHEVAHAVFDSLSELGLDYTEPPAFFEGYAQRVRTPSAVLAERAATCLDASVLLCSCLLQVGIDAGVLLADGHACAYFVSCDPARAEQWDVAAAISRELREPASADVNALVALIAAGIVVPVEATMLTSPSAVSFEAACSAAVEFTSVQQSSLNGFVNPTAAFRCGVVARASELVTVGAGLDSTDPWTTGLPSSGLRSEVDEPSRLAPSTPDERPRFRRPTAPPRVEEWKRSLLLLDLRNPLLSLGSAAESTRTLVLHCVPQVAQAALDRLESGVGLTVQSSVLRQVGVADSLERQVAPAGPIVHDGRLFWPDPLALAEQLDARANRIRASDSTITPGQALAGAEVDLQREHTELLSERLEKLRIHARAAERATGSNSLYLCVGVFEWVEEVGRTWRAPLYMVPIRIERSGDKRHRILLDRDGDTQLNFALLEMLRSVFGVDLPKLVEPPVNGRGAVDVESFIAELRASFGALRLPDVRVADEVVLDILDFAAARMWKDLDQHWATFASQPVFKHLLEHPGLPFQDPAGDEPLPHLVVPEDCDSFQLEAVRMAAAGRSFVLEGPPGTGKSQTITNLLAAAVALGRRVLFVAEKQTALEVVRRRLGELGLDQFCMDLFDHTATTARVGEQVRRCLECTPQDESAEWDRLEVVLGASQARLDSYRTALHEPGPAGISAWDAHQRLIELGEGDATDLNVDLARVGAPIVADTVAALAHFGDRVRRRTGGGRVTPGPWSLCDRMDFSGLNSTSVQEASDGMARALDVLEATPDSLRSCITATQTTEEVDGLVNLLRVLCSWPPPGPGLLEMVSSPDWTDLLTRCIRRLARVQEESQQCFGMVAPEVFDQDVGEMLRLAELSVSSGSSNPEHGAQFRAAADGWFSSDYQWSDDVMLEWLRLIVDLRGQWESLKDDLEALLGELIHRCPSLRDDRAIAYLSELRDLVVPQALEAWKSPVAQVLAAEPSLSSDQLGEVAAALTRLLSNWNLLVRHLGVTSASLDRWLAGRDVWDAWFADAPRWVADAANFGELQLWCDTLSGLQLLSGAGLSDLRESILCGREDLTGLAERFERSAVQAVVAERMEAPELALFSEVLHREAVAEWSNIFEARRKLTPGRIAGRVAGRADTASGGLGMLQRSLAVRRNRPSVRELITRHGREIATVAPCFLMSPESVARFIPPGSIEFDLVVFDEASQLEVARAVGAIGRAQSAVIVGDSQQMPPVQYMRRRPEGDDDPWADGTEVVLDLESILEECRESQLPSLMLANHYRSRHEELIAFSNHYFYGGQLRTTPSPERHRSSPMLWRRVDGWFRGAGDPGIPEGWDSPVGTNLVEAVAVVGEIERIVVGEKSGVGRWGSESRPSIGVVTSNRPQSVLIRELLAASESSEVRELLNRDDSSGLLVSNLEGVQGDERDIIMFSVGYSPRRTVGPDGSVLRGRLPLRFGPLNMVGGERRLNVAITRARERLYVFCSFDPSEMDTSSSQSRGVQLLRAFLVAASTGGPADGSVIGRAPSRRDAHRSDVAAALRGAGLEVVEDLGESASRVDVAIRWPGDGDWKMAILLDGPDWAARPTTFDREDLPVRRLRSAGWQSVERIWLPSWLNERQTVIDRIVAGIGPADPPRASTGSEDAAPPAVRPVGWEPVAPPESSSTSEVGWQRFERHEP